MEISLQYLKWVFHGISFRCLVYEISLFEATHVCNQGGHTPFKFGLVFLTPWATSEQVPYTDGNISSVAQMGLRRNWISSPVAEVMNIFAEGCSQPPKSRFFHIIFLNFGILLKFLYFSTHVQCHCQLGYGSTTNPRLWVNHTKPFSSLGIFTL
jgi:hypothetical protein